MARLEGIKAVLVAIILLATLLFYMSRIMFYPFLLTSVRVTSRCPVGNSSSEQGVGPTGLHPNLGRCPECQLCTLVCPVCVECKNSSQPCGSPLCPPCALPVCSQCAPTLCPPCEEHFDIVVNPDNEEKARALAVARHDLQQCEAVRDAIPRDGSMCTSIECKYMIDTAKVPGSWTPLAPLFANPSFILPLSPDDNSVTVTRLAIDPSGQFKFRNDMEFVTSYARQNSAATFVEVGSGLGTYSLYAAVNGMARVVSYEALPLQARLQSMAVLANGVESQVTVHNLAIGRVRPGDLNAATLYMPTYMAGAGSLVDWFSSPLNREEVTVAKSQLDDEIDFPVHLLRLSVNGAEEEVLEGGSRVLFEDFLVKDILIDYQSQARRNAGKSLTRPLVMLLDKGYSVRDIKRRVSLTVATLEGHLNQSSFFYLHAAAPHFNESGVAVTGQRQPLRPHARSSTLLRLYREEGLANVVSHKADRFKVALAWDGKNVSGTADATPHLVALDDDDDDDEGSRPLPLPSPPPVVGAASSSQDGWSSEAGRRPMFVMTVRNEVMEAARAAARLFARLEVPLAVVPFDLEFEHVAELAAIKNVVVIAREFLVARQAHEATVLLSGLTAASRVFPHCDFIAVDLTSGLWTEPSGLGLKLRPDTVSLSKLPGELAFLVSGGGGGGGGEGMPPLVYAPARLSVSPSAYAALDAWVGSPLTRACSLRTFNLHETAHTEAECAAHFEALTRKWPRVSVLF